MSGREFVEVDPRELHLPPSRMDGADPGKLQRQISRFGLSTAGMPPLTVWRGTDERYMISNGVTRATRVARFLPGRKVVVEVIGSIRIPASRFPTVEKKLP